MAKVQKVEVVLDQMVSEKQEVESVVSFPMEEVLV